MNLYKLKHAKLRNKLIGTILPYDLKTLWLNVLYTTKAFGMNFIKEPSWVTLLKKLISSLI